MSSKKKPSEPANDPHGVPLSTLLTFLRPSSIKARLEGSVLIADHGDYTTRVEVLPPDPRPAGPDPIRAVVRVLTTLPALLSSQVNLGTAAGAAMFNGFASLGAVTAPEHRLIVGSRLTIHDGEEAAWASLYLPLLAFAVVGAASGVLGGLGGLGGAFTQRSSGASGSEWTDSDLGELQRHLSRICRCSAGSGELSAWFGVTDGEVSDAAGDRAEASFWMSTEEAHPQLGGGLLCLMYLPQEIADIARLQQICELLNTRELDALDQPPHFGAWWPGPGSDRIVYISFLPNALHQVPGIASNFAIWGMHRAKWATRVLAAAGVNL